VTPLYDAPYRWFDHTADIGMEVKGETLPELFANAAMGLYDLLGVLEATVEKDVTDDVALRGADLEELFVSWLSELLYRFTTEGVVFADCDVRLEEDVLQARVAGGSLARPDRRPVREIKAVTYHSLEVTETADGWEAQVVFDV
jgi:SHS2 domain-containing protein